MLDFHTGGPFTPHQAVQANLWYGRVTQRAPEYYRDSGCDFCVFATKSWSSKLNLRAHSHAKYIDDAYLPKVKVAVKVDKTSAQRELDAMEKFWDEDFEKAIRAGRSLPHPET